MLNIIYGDVKNSIYNTNVFILKTVMNQNGLMQNWRKR